MVRVQHSVSIYDRGDLHTDNIGLADDPAPVAAESTAVPSNDQSIVEPCAKSTTKRKTKSTGRSKSTKSKAKSAAKAPLKSTAQSASRLTLSNEMRKVIFCECLQRC